MAPKPAQGPDLLFSTTDFEIVGFKKVHGQLPSEEREFCLPDQPGHIIGLANNVSRRVLFLLSAVIEVLLNRHHKKQKRYGPGPSNNYTSGRSKKQPFWKRSRKTKTRDAELGTISVGGAGLAAADGSHHHNKTLRPSHDTTVTGSTAAAPAAAYDDNANNKYQTSTLPVSNPAPGAVHDRQPYAEVHHGGSPHVERV